MNLEYEKLLKKFKRQVKADMKALNVYKPEFENLINIYSGMLAQYEIITKRLIENEFNIETETQRGGTKKSALATTQEKLRTDIVIYGDRLLLNPKSLRNAKLESKGKTSKLYDVLSKLE
ncbi:P27 family phage terminase small subunit [Clostridium kluyveri]